MRETAALQSSKSTNLSRRARRHIARHRLLKEAGDEAGALAELMAAKHCADEAVAQVRRERDRFLATIL
jgi:hypothetical protein